MRSVGARAAGTTRLKLSLVHTLSRVEAECGEMTGFIRFYMTGNTLRPALRAGARGSRLRIAAGRGATMTARAASMRM